MIKKTFKIVNKKGLHARAAAAFAKEADRFKCEITVEKDHNKVTGNSILGLLLLSASEGTEITVTATGPDEKKAIASLEALVSNRFNEEA